MQKAPVRDEGLPRDAGASARIAEQVAPHVGIVRAREPRLWNLGCVP